MVDAASSASPAASSPTAAALAHGPTATPSVSSASPSTTATSPAATASHPYNILMLTEIRSPSWSRIYTQGLAAGNAGLSTTTAPTWQQFDAVMLKSFRFIAVHYQRNSAAGWIATFVPFPSLSLGLGFDAPVQPRGKRRRAGSSAPLPPPQQGGPEGGVLELVVFVAEDERGRGIGSQLVAALIEALQHDRRWSTLQATTFPENEAALRLLLRFDFVQVGMRRKIGKMLDGPEAGSWRDVLIFEKKLSSRPPAARGLSVDDAGLYDAAGPGLGAVAGNDTISPAELVKRPRLS